MSHTATTKTRALELARTRGIARARDFAAEGIAPVYLQRLVTGGQLVRLGRGLYQLADSEFAAAHTLAEAARIVPHGVVCLLSALQFHQLTTQSPHLVWMMIGARKWAPTSSPVGLKIVRATGEALAAGIEHQTVEGVLVPVTGPAKTVVDCFKHRSKVGLDVAIEALRECLRRKVCTTDQLWHFAGICRVQSVMRPYLEALL
ncbi:MAG: type IV toxin-antitoxin system AbiEi family antitoxin domain-containing protein [Alphaproteobacteria bacterium]|nr:type IV toxin-antitoxin system AbiEi family antitoxin domain-containing protein [Alphaproteobacteria bacterium]